MVYFENIKDDYDEDGRPYSVNRVKICGKWFIVNVREKFGGVFSVVTPTYVAELEDDDGNEYIGEDDSTQNAINDVVDKFLEDNDCDDINDEYENNDDEDE